MSVVVSVELLLTLDPGTLNTGWAVHEYRQVELEDDPHFAWEVIDSGTWVRPNTVLPAEAHGWMWEQYLKKLLEVDPDEVWLEAFYPYGGRPRKNTHALITLVGGYLALPQWDHTRTVSVGADEWKRWRKKNCTEEELEVMRALCDTEHEYDAVTLGWYAQEQLKKEKKGS
jgi:hypothetical protein